MLSRSPSVIFAVIIFVTCFCLALRGLVYSKQNLHEGFSNGRNLRGKMRQRHRIFRRKINDIATRVHSHVHSTFNRMKSTIM